MLGVAGGLVLLWVLLILLLLIEQRRHPDRASLTDLLRLAPDVVRLVKRLALDRTVSVGVRIWLGALLLYLLSPIDLVPDFIPVIGYADDAIIVALALRSPLAVPGPRPSNGTGRAHPGAGRGAAAGGARTYRRRGIRTSGHESASASYHDTASSGAPALHRVPASV